MLGIVFELLAELLIARGSRIIAMTVAGGVLGSWLADRWLGAIPGLVVGFLVALWFDKRSEP